MVKKMWRDREGVIAPLTIVLVVILVVALLAVGYMAVAAYEGAQEKNPDQVDDDLDDNDEPDPIIGRIKVDVKVKILNPDYALGTDDDVIYSIDRVTTTLVEAEQGMSILEMFDLTEIWSGDANLKLTCKLIFVSSDQTLISPSTAGGQVEWDQEYEGTGTSIGDVTTYHSEAFYSGGVKYYGAYFVEVTLFKDVSGSWEQQDIKRLDVSI